MARTNPRRSPAKGKKRPITVALNIVRRMQHWPISRKRTISSRSHTRLVKILTSLNAASGTTDARSAARRARTVKKHAKG